MPLECLHDYGPLNFIATSPDGHWLSIYGSDVGEQALFAPATDTRLLLPPLAEKYARRVHGYSPDNVYHLSVEGNLREPEIVVIRAIGGGDEAREVMRFAGDHPPGLLNLLSISPDGRLFAVPAGKTFHAVGVAIHRLPEGDLVARLDGGVTIGFIDAIRWLPDNTLILLGASQNVLQFDVANQRLLHQIQINRRIVRAAFAPNGSAVALFTSEAAPREPDPDAMQWIEVVAFPGGHRRFRHAVPQPNSVMCLAFSPDSLLLAVTYHLGIVQILDATTGDVRDHLPLDGCSSKYGQAHFLTDGTLLVFDGSVRVYAITS